MSIVKVSPDPGLDQNDQDRSIKSVSFAKHMDASGEFSSNKSPTSVSVKPIDDKNTPTESVPSKSQIQRKYHPSRASTFGSFFRSGSDVFDVDENYSKTTHGCYFSSTKSNKWNARKSPLRRLFTLSCMRAPRVFSADELCSFAKVGDLLLYREGASFEHMYLSPEVSRGMKSSLDGKYIPKIRQIKMWNHIGVVVSLYRDEENDFIKYILYADDIGFRVRKLSEVINSCVLSHNRCALRPVHFKKSKDQQLFFSFIDDIESVAILALRGKLLWSSFERADLCKNEDRASIDEDVLLLLDNPIISRFHALFTQRMQSLAFRPSQEGVQEATRLFNSMMAVHRENESEKEMEDGEAVLSSIKSLTKSAKSTLPLEIIFKSLSALNDDNNHAEEAKQGEGGDEFAVRLRNMLEGLDDNQDGQVSLDEFVDAFLRIPCAIIPVEFDLPSTAMGEMVACLYVSLGVFHEGVLEKKTFFHPQSFSSSSTREGKKVKNESEKSKIASDVPRITKNMFQNPKKTKFKEDILLLRVR